MRWLPAKVVKIAGLMVSCVDWSSILGIRISSEVGRVEGCRLGCPVGLVGCVVGCCDGCVVG